MALFFIKFCFRFSEVEQLGQQLAEKHRNVELQLEQLEEAQKTVQDMWQDKQMWLQQRLDLQVFNREADQLNSMCTSQDTLLDAAVLGVWHTFDLIFICN